MPAALRFADSEARDDLLTFASRTARLADPEVRLQAAGGTLAMWAPALIPRGILDATPTILALRVLPVDPELVCDLTVNASGIAADPMDPRGATLPASAVRAVWAGVGAPRGAWRRIGEIDAAALAARAHEGIARVADDVPRDAGAELVQKVRSIVWGDPVAEWFGLPRGVGFAAFSLGFIAGGEAAGVHRSGAWARVSLRRGHILVRGAVLTA
jgi:hypothetical protein